MDKGMVEVEVDVMDVFLLGERGEGGFCDEGGVNADVVDDVGCTPTKECSDVVTVAPPIVGMVFSSWQDIETYYRGHAKQRGFGVIVGAWSGYKAKDKTRQHRNAQWTCDRFGKPNRRRKVVRKVVNEHQNHNPTPSKSRFIAAHCKEETNYHVKRKLNLGHLFNDVVCFDTTYLTNQYELPFANFIGVNHHGQIILLRCALISYETTETFEWVFRTWVHCMRGIAPGGILTNQVAAMRNALRSTMHETSHQMKTTQRVESIHSFFDDYVNKHTTLAEFVEMYYRAMEKRAKTERQYDAHTETLDRYILRRWMKDVSRKHTPVKVVYHDPSKTEHVLSYDEMQLAFEPIFSKASIFKNTKQLVLEFPELLDIRVDEKRVMIETEILNQTPLSVCMKDK
ncbi:Protein FAR1-RELATED SEQUENCE 8 [Bienertia sinuspersici]